MTEKMTSWPAEWRYSPLKKEVPTWNPSQVSGALKWARAQEWREGAWKAANLQTLLSSLNSLFPAGAQNAMWGGNSAIVDAAKTFEGTPYKMWGQSKENIDCSGLVVEAMKLAGTPIPDMTAADMQSKTPKISAAEAQPGDLLIWNDGKHVEIVVSASGDQVTTIGSASSRGGVSEGHHPLSGKTIHKNTLWGQGGMSNSPNQMAA